MTTEQITKRVNEIMKEHKINWTWEIEIAMSLAYVEGRVDLSSENLKKLEGNK